MNDKVTRADQAALQRKRLRRAGEPLVENSSLRDALDDEQANQLLAWGLAQIEREVETTLDLDDEEALPLLEERAGIVRRIMRQVNDLVDSLPRLDETDSWAELLRLAQQLRQLQASPEEKLESARETFALAKTREELDREATFTYLMDILQRDEPA